MFKFETMKKSIADAQKKKERKEFLNKVGNAAGTALGYAAIGVLATANALAEADLQASSSYNSRTTSSGYYSSGYNSRYSINLSCNYMKDFMKSFGSIGTRFEDRLEMSFLHKSYDGDNAFVSIVRLPETNGVCTSLVIRALSIWHSLITLTLLSVLQVPQTITSSFGSQVRKFATA